MIRIFKTPLLARWIFPRRVWGFSSSDTVYLTFDDGPTEEMTQWILSTLDEKEVKATFFCVGANAEKFPELVAEIGAKGHAVGNHTMRHEKGTSVSEDTYQKSIEEAARHIPSRLFRPPYGRLPRKFDAKIHPEYKIIMWSWLSYDFDTSIPVETILQKAGKQIRPGDILVLHDNEKVEERVKMLLPQLIDSVHERGLKFGVISA
jgi:peptidoglycan/xylan/chitin deacetylase (PgdA/CDA1 family)